MKSENRSFLQYYKDYRIRRAERSPAPGKIITHDLMVMWSAPNNANPIAAVAPFLDPEKKKAASAKSAIFFASNVGNVANFYARLQFNMRTSKLISIST